MPITLEEVSNGDITKWSTNTEEAFICESASVDDCYLSFQLDDLYLMTGIEIYSSVSSQCFPKILELEYSVRIYCFWLACHRWIFFVCFFFSCYRQYTIYIHKTYPTLISFFSGKIYRIKMYTTLYFFFAFEH